ncbi:MAG: hypothetical protein ACXVAN_01490 [Polyangia bacterium]
MAALFAAALAASLALLVHLHGNGDHWPALGAAARPLELLAILSCVLMGLAIYGRRRGAAHAARPLRLVFYVLVLTWLSSIFHDYEQGGSYYSFIIGFGALAALDAFGPALARRAPRLADACDLVCMNVCVLFVGLELVLRVAAAVTHSPLLVQESTDAKGWLAANKLHPGDPIMGFVVNRNGYNDEEFHKKDKCLVTAVGDSFTVGVVPHEFHFATVAERELGCPIDAIGVCAVGPEEYALMVRDDALPLDPDVVLINLFVGNDIVDNLRGRDHFRGGMRRWLDRHNLLVYELPRRLAILARERRNRKGPVEPVPIVPVRGQILSRDELVRTLPWLTDPARELPSMSHEAFLTLETRHAVEIGGGGDEPYYKRFWEIVDEMRAAVAPRKLAILLIPDELQVEDPVWREISARAGRPLDRERAQRILARTLTEKGIPYLDLLPILRAEPAGSDGMRHLFHRDDSHLNARGNAVAGKALALFLRPLLPAR